MPLSLAWPVGNSSSAARARRVPLGLGNQGKLYISTARTKFIPNFPPLVRMDLHEDSDKNLVTATFELPGVSKEDVSLNVQNSRLTITAETKHSSEHDEGGYAVRERRYGKWSRTLQMPSGIKVSGSINYLSPFFY